MGKHEGGPKKYKPYIAPKPKDEDTLCGRNGKHSGGKGDNKDNKDNGDKK
ncbi:hypothetical protein AB0H88_09870 [Nonomuraea sp. NPDC050680]